MVRKVIWSDTAKSELKNIFDYYCEAAGKSIAHKIIRRIVIKTDKFLRSNPEIGPIEKLLTGKEFKYRYLISTNYKIIYRVEDTRVIIAAIFDCRRNPSKLSSSL